VTKHLPSRGGKRQRCKGRKVIAIQKWPQAGSRFPGRKQPENLSIPQKELEQRFDSDDEAVNCKHAAKLPPVATAARGLKSQQEN